MDIGFIGLGKLGFPVAFAIAAKGHTVRGFDISYGVQEMVRDNTFPHQEQDLEPLLQAHRIHPRTVDMVVAESDIVFLAVQTPHDPKFEGITRLPEERVDFDYEHLKAAVKSVAYEATRQRKTTTLVVISTVLPGTVEREVVPLLGDYVRLCYNPFFIAMGTVVRDFLNPEFVLLGGDCPEATEQVRRFYETIHDKPVFVTSIKNAEMIKVVYNTYISSKIAFINTVMEICHKTGADVDAVSDALALATDRIVSPKYMRGGMGDGGGCHPRDNIALSWLARKLDLSYDYFEHIMLAREKQTEFLADIIEEQTYKTWLPLVLMGAAFKPNTNLATGSPALLLSAVLNERKNLDHHIYDPYIPEYGHKPTWTAIYFIATKHDVFRDWKFPNGSLVIDPFGYIPEDAASTVIHVGRP